jgi:hypothetical protein
MPGKGARVKGVDVSYLAARDSDIVQRAPKTPCHSASSTSSPRARIAAARSHTSWVPSRASRSPPVYAKDDDALPPTLVSAAPVSSKGEGTSSDTTSAKTTPAI